MVRKFAFIGLLAIALSGCASEYSISPTPGEGQQMRYAQGLPTLYSVKRLGAIQLTPLKVSDGMRLAFGIAAFNRSTIPSNFGAENVSIEQADGTPDKVFTSNELIHEARVGARWKAFATALAGGLASASSYSTTRGTAYTPVGRLSFSSTSYDPGRAAEIQTETRENIADIRTSLDHAVSSIHQESLQTTTVNPGDSYGGIVIAAKLSSGQYPQSISLRVNWNGEDHDFRFVVAKGPPTVPNEVATASSGVIPADEFRTAVAAEPKAVVAIAPANQVKLSYGYTDNSGQPLSGSDSAPAATPQAMSFEQWEKANKKTAH
jgi:hypothetical protein